MLLGDGIFLPLLFSFMPFPAFCPTPFPQAGNVSVQGKGSLGHFSWIWLKLARFRKNIHRSFSLKPQSVKQFKKPLRFLTFYYFLTSWKATYTLGILISNFKCCEKNEKKKKKKACNFWEMFSSFCSSCCLEICVPITTLKKNHSTSLMPLKRPWHWRKVILRKGP